MQRKHEGCVHKIGLFLYYFAVSKEKNAIERVSQALTSADIIAAALKVLTAQWRLQYLKKKNKK